MLQLVAGLQAMRRRAGREILGPERRRARAPERVSQPRGRPELAGHRMCVEDAQLRACQPGHQGAFQRGLVNAGQQLATMFPATTPGS